jgi:hypothetical protein
MMKIIIKIYRVKINYALFSGLKHPLPFDDVSKYFDELDIRLTFNLKYF